MAISRAVLDHRISQADGPNFANLEGLFEKRPLYLFEINLQSMKVYKFFTIPLASLKSSRSPRVFSVLFQTPLGFCKINP
jgi:hypothetical protein